MKGRGQIDSPGKTTLKSPALLGLKYKGNKIIQSLFENNDIRLFFNDEIIFRKPM